jgi:transposase
MKGTSPSRASRAVASTGNKVSRWEVQSLINLFVKGKSMTIVTVGIDLAKNVFAVHGVDATGKPVLIRPSVARARLTELMVSLPPCMIGMEACSGAPPLGKTVCDLRSHRAPYRAQICHAVPSFRQTWQT